MYKQRVYKYYWKDDDYVYVELVFIPFSNIQCENFLGVKSWRY